MELNLSHEYFPTRTCHKVDAFVQSLICDKNKNVKESIILGDVTLPSKFPDNSLSYYLQREGNHYTKDDMKSNSQIINCMLKHFQLSLANEKKKAIENSLEMVDLKIEKLKNQMNHIKQMENSQKIISSKNQSIPINQAALSQRQIELNERIYFISKISKERGIRLIQEEEKRRKLENKLKEIRLGERMRTNDLQKQKPVGITSITTDQFNPLILKSGFASIYQNERPLINLSKSNEIPFPALHPNSVQLNSLLSKSRYEEKKHNE